MILNSENIHYFVPIREQELIKSLLQELQKYNNDRDLFQIDIQTYHNEYSPERTDPCPDYYLYYRLKYNNVSFCEMTLDELDNAIYLITTFIDIQNESKKPINYS